MKYLAVADARTSRHSSGFEHMTALQESWFNAGVGRLQCLPWDAETGLQWAELLARLRAAGKAMPIKDSLIAATAAVHGLAVATRNRTDFVNAGVRVVDPFAG